MTGMQDQNGINPNRHHPFSVGETGAPRISRGFIHSRDVKAVYRGEVKGILVNLGHEPILIERGERTAQTVPAPVLRGPLNGVAERSAAAKGNGGFGSTGQ